MLKGDFGMPSGPNPCFPRPQNSPPPKFHSNLSAKKLITNSLRSSTAASQLSCGTSLYCEIIYRARSSCSASLNCQLRVQEAPPIPLFNSSNCEPPHHRTPPAVRFHSAVFGSKRRKTKKTSSSTTLVIFQLPRPSSRYPAAS